MPTPLAELAGAMRRLVRQRSECPKRYKPTQTVLFAGLDQPETAYPRGRVTGE